MRKITVPSEFFSAKDALECGQIFRYIPYNEAYLVFSADKACLIKTAGDQTEITTDDSAYFENYFDLTR